MTSDGLENLRFLNKRSIRGRANYFIMTHALERLVHPSDALLHALAGGLTLLKYI